jgi:hypothetical protein
MIDVRISEQLKAKCTKAALGCIEAQVETAQRQRRWMNCCAVAKNESPSWPTRAPFWRHQQFSQRARAIKRWVKIRRGIAARRKRCCAA